jgi:signal transduction histidine kinase
MSCDNGQFAITVSDNGKGIINQQSDGSGNGIKNMKQRIQKLNGNFFIKNEEGLTLTFEIPFQQTT